MAVPINEIIRQETEEYLASMSTVRPPDPSTIERELLEQVNDHIESENTGRLDRTQKLPYLKTLTPAQISAIMLHLHKVCRIAPSGKNTDRDYDLLAIYADGDENPDQGIYITSEDNMRAMARKYNYGLSTLDFKEILANLKDAAERKERCHDRDLIAVNNGIFNYATKELEDFSPDLVFLSKSHVDYEPAAQNVVIHNDDDDTDWDVESWMDSLSDDPEVVSLLWEILGAIIRPHVRWNKSAWFYSEEGNNGKGTLCELMRNLTGPTAYASIPIADFGKDFLLEPLTRASAIIVDENDVGTFIDRAANLKAVITNDVISINRKFKTPIAYQFYGFMVQCLNEFPRIKDKSESFYRRQLFVPFMKNFKGIERRYIKDDYLHRDEVLQYVLRKVLNMDYYALSEPEACLEVLKRYKDFNDPIRSFWNEHREEFVWDLLPFPFLYELYQAWTEKTNPSGKPIGRNIFISDLLQIIKNDADWYCTNQDLKIRPGNKMDRPEHLSVHYSLENWTNPTFKGNDLDKRATFTKKSSYRGLLRATAGPSFVSLGAAGTDDEDTDEDRDDTAPGTGTHRP